MFTYYHLHLNPFPSLAIHRSLHKNTSTPYKSAPSLLRLPPALSKSPQRHPLPSRPSTRTTISAMSLPHTHRPISTNLNTLSYNTRTESHPQYIVRHLNRLWNGPVGLTELIKYLVLCTFSGILSMRASCLLAEYGKPLSWWPPHWTLEILFMTVTSVGGVAGIYILLKLARRVVDRKLFY